MLEFPGLSLLTAAVRNAVQYIVSNADLESRPPRLRPIASSLPLSSGLDINQITLEPYPWSALVGLVTPCGVEWDYYGNPFRARPAIGAVETTQF